MKNLTSAKKRIERNRSKLKRINVDRFRITVTKSLKNISAQIIDDRINKTIVSASSNEKENTRENGGCTLYDNMERGGEMEKTNP